MELKTQQRIIIDTIDYASETILSISHQIHAHPELAHEEKFASGLLADTLETFGFDVERGVAGMETAFCARKGKVTGPHIAFLAEYDALPGLGHACGHNIIATSALGAGIGLGRVIDELDGQVWVVGTPAEETTGGKVTMVKGGFFQQVDAALMIHPYGANYKYTQALAMDEYQVEFFGKSAHAAAAPWEGVNALDALLLTFTNVNALRQQMQPDARIHGVITHGGGAPNIIPEYTAGRFYVRAAQRHYLDKLVEQFKACAQAAALATATRVQITHMGNSFDDILQNNPLTERLHDYLVGVLGSGQFESSPVGIGSTDLGNVSHVVPAIHVMLDISSDKRVLPHTPEFCDAAASPTADAVILRAAKGLALTGYDLLTDSVFLQEARDNFAGAGNHQSAQV